MNDTITGSSLLQTEHILLKYAPELVPFIRQIRCAGTVNVRSSAQDESPSSFSIYVVNLPKEACRLIRDVTQRVETACNGHPATTRELAALWRQLAERAS